MNFYAYWSSCNEHPHIVPRALMCAYWSRSPSTLSMRCCPPPSTESRLLCTLNWVFYSCFYFKHPTIQLSNFPQFSCATCRILRRNFLFFQIFQVFLNYLSVFFVFQRFFSNRFLDFVSILSVVVLLMMRNSENLQRKSYLQCHGNFIQLSSFRSYINAH